MYYQNGGGADEKSEEIVSFAFTFIFNSLACPLDAWEGGKEMGKVGVGGKLTDWTNYVPNDLAVQLLYFYTLFETL